MSASASIQLKRAAGEGIYPPFAFFRVEIYMKINKEKQKNAILPADSAEKPEIPTENCRNRQIIFENISAINKKHLMVKI